MRTKTFRLGFTVLCGTGVLLSGCATKKYVAKELTPVNTKVQQVEKRNSEQDQQLDTLETGLSKQREQSLELKEGLTRVDGQLKATTETAQGAASSATQAQQQAGQAQQQATDARRYAGTRADTLEKTIVNLDNYKLAQTANVTFKVGRADLDAEGKAALDGVVQAAHNVRRYALEIQGFTDSTGPAALNLDLSQRRAEAVVRYLTLDNKVPLRNVHLIGAGSSAPVADNKTRQGRQQNRRVEIRLFTSEADTAGSPAPTSASR